MPLIIDSPGPASCFLDFHKQSNGEVKRSHTILRTACAPHTKEDEVHCLTSLTSNNFSSSAKTQCDVASFYANSSPRSLGCIPGVLRSSFLPGQYPEQLAPFFERIPQSPFSSKKDVYPDALAASSQPPVKPVVCQCSSHHDEPSAEALVSQRAGICCSGNVIPNAIDSAAAAASSSSVSSQRVNRISYVPHHFSNHTSHPSGPIGPSFVYQSKRHELAYGSRQQPSASRGVAVARCDAMGNADPTHTKEKVLPLIASQDAQCAKTSPMQQQPSNVELSSCVGLPMFKLHNIAVWKGSILGRGYSGVVHRGLGVVFSESNNDCVRMSQPVALKISEHKVAERVRYTTMTTQSREFDVLKLLYEKNVPVPKPLSFSTHTDTQGRCQTVLSMELIEGQTLRDWINSQTAYVVQHRCTGRTLHPAMSLEHALDRVDVALSLLDALTKLHPFGTFVDLKPRNVMVTSEVSVNDYTESNTSVCDKDRFTLHFLCHEKRPRWRVTLVDMGGVVLRRDVAADAADDCCSCTPFSQPQLHCKSCVLHCNESVQVEEAPCTHQLTSPVKTARPAALDSFTNSPQSLSTAPSSVSRNPISIQAKVDATTPLFAAHALTTEHCLGLEAQRAQKSSIAKKFSETTRTVVPHSELKPRIAVEDGLRIYPTRHRHFLETTCSYVSPEVSAAIVHSDFCKGRLAHHFQPCLKEFLASSRFTKHVVDDSATAGRLEYAYAALAPVLASQHIIHYDERVDGRQAETEAQECYVRLGEKSSVFSLGLILVELFGGLRTGLTGLCQFPVVSEWFASRDVLKQKAKNTLPTPVNTAPQSMDREFRIALEWNLRQLPIVVSTSPSHSEYFDMPTLQQIVTCGSGSSSSSSSSVVATPPHFSSQCSSDIMPRCDDVLSTSPSRLTTHVDSRASSRRVIWLSSFYDVYKQYCYPKEGLLASARRAPAAHTTPKELLISQGSRLSVKYNDVMQKLHVLISQQRSFLSEHNMSESSYLRKEDVLTLQKELVESILDGCLQGSPDRRPTFAMLKHALLMLRQLVCFQVIERNSCEH